MSDSHGGAGSYLTHSLDPAEREEFEVHVRSCETCRKELLEFGETLSQLSVLSATAPPAALKASVMAAIGGVRALPPGEPQGTAVPDSAPVRTSGPAAEPSPVDELALRRQRRLTRVLSLAVAAMTVVALGLGAWAVSLVQRQAPVATSTVEAELLRAPDLEAHTVELKDGGTATILASRRLNRAMLSSPGLPALPAGRTYQLWTLAGPLTAPTRVSPDVLVSGGTVVKVWFTGPIAESDALAISTEAAGGASAPTDIQAAAAL